MNDTAMNWTRVMQWTAQRRELKAKHDLTPWILAALGAALLAIVLLGCASKLESGGAYAPGTFSYTTNAAGDVSTNFVASAAPDKAFYIADASFYEAYSLIDGAFGFERENRAALWKLSPDIKHTLDKIRPDAVLARKEYITARKAYMANPTPAGLDALQTVLAKLQQLGATASAVTTSLP